MLLEVNNLSIGFKKGKGEDILVHNVSFSILPGRVMGLVGESGSGKTLTASALCGLLKPPLRQTRGKIVFQGQEIKPGRTMDWNKLRGTGVFFLFQSPLAALNPTLTVGKQVEETLIKHFKIDTIKCRNNLIKLFEEVGVDPGKAEYYPFELSGGMRQRVLLAMALGLRPRLLIADEPFTGLDPIRQREILILLEKVQAQGTAVLVISHDLRLISGWADQVAVMVAGNLVEMVDGKNLVREAVHPYTQSLIQNMRRMEAALDLAPSN